MFFYTLVQKAVKTALMKEDCIVMVHIPVSLLHAYSSLK